MGYSIRDIYTCLGVYASKDMTPGKFMNNKYDYVEYVQYYGKSFDVYNDYVVDWNLLRTIDEQSVRVALNLEEKRKTCLLLKKE